MGRGEKMNYKRHEQKYICSSYQIEHLLKILPTILPFDKHQKDSSYHVKSLYFDTPNNRFLSESLNGIPKRLKYRLRQYDNNNEKFKFECKSSFFHLKQKRFVWVKKEELDIFLNNEITNDLPDDVLINEFYCLKKTESLKPKLIIDYDRTAFVHEALNVRITLDKNITQSNETDLFFDETYLRKNILEDKAGILEVKFDDVLPTYITHILGLEDLKQTSFSKYVMGRTPHKY